MKRKIKKILAPVYSCYHFVLAGMSAVWYGFPSRKIIVIGVTGTKGKTSTTEYLNAILEASGRRTALLNGIRIKIGNNSATNTKRMSMPGRFFIQSFLHQALKANSDIAIIEMTSEGARQHRHRFISMNGLIFLNIAPEHIESHGSFARYADAKFSIAKAVVDSDKRPRIIVANISDTESKRYLALHVEKSASFAVDATQYAANDKGGAFVFDNTQITVNLPGKFSIQNALAAATMARELGADTSSIKRGIESIVSIPGRAQRIDAGQKFTAIVDYAHTPDSLEALYSAYEGLKKICVVSATGGGRDTWKRPVMGAVADRMCDIAIITNEDPFDEEPMSIIDAVAIGMQRKPTIIVDRREAIAYAILQASKIAEPCAVLITGKGTDPSICGKNGTSIPWSDADVVREELEKLLARGNI